MEDYERPPMPGGGMRVSDQDRDSALELLGQHTAAGRLTLDELIDLCEAEIDGGNTEHGARRPPRPGAPLVRIRTYNLLGGSTIFRLPPQARGLPLRKARKMAKAAARGKLPAPR